MQYEKIIYVGGMSCENCRRHVEAALRKIEAADEIEIDLPSGRVRIGFSQDVKDEQIRHAIEDAGYQMLDQK